MVRMPFAFETVDSADTSRSICACPCTPYHQLVHFLLLISLRSAQALHVLALCSQEPPALSIRAQMLRLLDTSAKYCYCGLISNLCVTQVWPHGQAQLRRVLRRPGLS